MEPGPEPAPTPSPTPTPKGEEPTEPRTLHDDPKGEQPPEGEEKAEGAEGEESKDDDKGEQPEALTLEQLKLPEGLNTEDPLIGRFLESMNKEYETPAERGQALIDLFSEASEQWTAEAQNAFLETQEGWKTDLIKQHGDKALDEKLGKITSLIDRYDEDMKGADPSNKDTEFGEALRDAFSLTGAGNNPATVNFLIWLAEQQSEGSPLSGTPAGGAEQSRAEKMFGT